MSDLIFAFPGRLRRLSAYDASRRRYFLFRRLTAKQAKVPAYQASRANACHLSGGAGTLQPECSIRAPECAVSTRFPPTVCIPSTASNSVPSPISRYFSVPSDVLGGSSPVSRR